MLHVLKFLLLLQVFICYGSIYYDSEIWYDEKQEDTDIYIESDDVYIQMLVSGGYRPVSPTHTKYLASIRTNTPTAYFGDNHYCSGTIVGYQMIITAAHCIMNAHRIQTRARRIKVVLGTPNRLHKTAYTVERGVSAVFIHPGFQRNGFHDIAILYLEREIPFDNPLIELVSLVSERPKPGTKCTTLGWGQIIYMGPFAADAIYVDLEVLHPDDCKKWGHLFHNEFELCVGDWSEPDKGICRGDSGSPLICDNKFAGVVSKGMECGENITPAVFTDIYSHLNWIYEVQNSQVQLAISILLLVDCLLIAFIFFL